MTKKYFTAILMALVLFGGYSGNQSLAYGNRTVTEYGDLLQIIIPMSASIICAHKDRSAGLDDSGQLMLVPTVAISVVASEALKRIVDSKRPDGSKHSFPSGHSTAAFAGASFLHYRYGWQYGLPAYGLATFVGYSRVQAKRHRVADVVGGAILAGTVAHWLTEKQNDNVQILPFSSSPKDVGVALKVKF